MININGKIYSGHNINIINNKIFIDNVDQTPDAKDIKITVSGNIDTLSVDYCNELIINGNVNVAKCGSGNLNCNDIGGSVNTGSGDLTCNNVNGNVTTGSGDVLASIITGSVKTGSGDIKYNK